MLCSDGRFGSLYWNPVQHMSLQNPRVGKLDPTQNWGVLELAQLSPTKGNEGGGGGKTTHYNAGSIIILLHVCTFVRPTKTSTFLSWPAE